LHNGYSVGNHVSRKDRLMNRRPQEGRPVVRVRLDRSAPLPSQNSAAARLKAAAKKPKKPAETEAQRYRRMMGSEEEIVARGNREQARESAESKVISRTGTGYGSTRGPR
jgi:hypothetical protein